MVSENKDIKLSSKILSQDCKYTVKISQKNCLTFGTEPKISPEIKRPLKGHLYIQHSQPRSQGLLKTGKRRPWRWLVK
jgi:hypothetical protein